MDELESFFLEPHQNLQRRYEVLRALCVEKLPAKEVAQRFGYSIFTVNAMKRDFAKLIKRGQKPEFFLSATLGRKPKEHRDQLRQQVISLRKQNYSILDIKAALGALGYEISHDFIHRVLVEDGFARLPRRSALDKRRGAVTKLTAPRSQVIHWQAEVGKKYHSECGIGLLAFLPLLAKLKVDEWIELAGYPQTNELDRTQSVLSFLALKLAGYERYSHDDLWAMDRSLGLFAGLNVLPKDATLSSYSYRVEREMNRRFLRAMLRSFEHEGLLSGMVNLDFSAVPHWGDASVLENNWSGKRRKALKSVLALLCQDPDSGIFCYSDAEVRHRNQPDCVLEFVDFWKSEGHKLKCLIFDSKFTTYANFVKLDRGGVKFITLRRRSKNLLAEVATLAPESWLEVRLQGTDRKYTKLKVHDAAVQLPKFNQPFRQLTVTEHGREKPAFILTNDWQRQTAQLISQYGRRWLVEKGISEQIDFFHLNSLSSSIVVKVDFDLTLTVAAHNLYRAMALMLEGHEWETSKSLNAKFFANGGAFEVMGDRIRVYLKKKRHLPILIHALNEIGSSQIPWLENRLVEFEPWTVS
jgi:transposase